MLLHHSIFECSRQVITCGIPGHTLSHCGICRNVNHKDSFAFGFELGQFVQQEKGSTMNQTTSTAKNCL